MNRGCFTVASHMSEFGEEFLNYHRDEDHRIVKLRDDLLSATRYAFMMRRSGKTLDSIESYGRGPGVSGEYGPAAAFTIRQRRRSQRASTIICSIRGADGERTQKR